MLSKCCEAGKLVVLFKELPHRIYNDYQHWFLSTRDLTMINQPNVLIYHNPRCSKSRATLELLRQNGIEPTVVEYLKNPPDHQTLEHILTLLGADPRDLMRKREAAYAANSLEDPSLSRDQLIAAMVANPILIERPIVLANNKAAVGRPPENVLGIVNVTRRGGPDSVNQP